MVPAYFGEEHGRYSGAVATEEIKAGDPLFTVSCKNLINTKIAFNSELKDLFRQYPFLFDSKHPAGEDNILIVFLMYEI